MRVFHWHVLRLHCSAGALATSGPPFSVKNIMELCVVAVESARLGFARMASSPPSTEKGMKLGGSWRCALLNPVRVYVLLEFAIAFLPRDSHGGR
ncbi:hypothetical protein B296_00023038 [Ensete ventricosum]|uniref:Secreted protein n=1 Tax=Ensete ventricosum TaxID=4639 RepID=A0A426YT40_ENSVE|nr:hypothetical protein B296_00023038 [Ensete ventricosum]